MLVPQRREGPAESETCQKEKRTPGGHRYKTLHASLAQTQTQHAQTQHAQKQHVHAHAQTQRITYHTMHLHGGNFLLLLIISRRNTGLATLLECQLITFATHCSATQRKKKKRSISSIVNQKHTQHQQTNKNKTPALQLSISWVWQVKNKKENYTAHTIKDWHFTDTLYNITQTTQHCHSQFHLCPLSFCITTHLYPSSAIFF